MTATLVEQSRPAMALETVWCAIPVYNNAATICDVALRARQRHAQVVVIDDGSTDADLRELLKDIDVTVIRHEANRGKGAALLTAMRFAAERGAQYLITLDGDGQHYPEDLPAFFQALEPNTILIGYRDKVEGEMPTSSRFGREFSDFWVQVETGQRLADTQSGFRAYPITHILKLPFCTRHYNFEIEVVTRALWAGLKVQKVPIRVWYAERGQRVSSFRPFMDNLRISLIHSRLVGRRLLPIAHRRLVSAPPKPSLRRPIQYIRAALTENATPLGLAASAGVGIFIGALAIPFLHVALVLYVCVRLHLNKGAALLIQNLCMPPFVPIFCIAVGYRLRHGYIIDINNLKEIASHPAERMLEWVIGSLIVAPILAIFASILVYIIAHQVQSRRRADPVSTLP